MFRAFFYVSVLGALLTLSKSDFSCFSDKWKNLENDFYQILRESKEICGDGQKELIDSIQHAIDQCSVNVSTDSMKSLLQELCDPGSELLHTLLQSGACLLSNRNSDIDCKLNAVIDLDLPAVEACLKVKREFSTCSAYAIGGSCGAKAVKALLRIYQTSDALTNGQCEELFSPSSSLTTTATEWPTTDWSTMDLATSNLPAMDWQTTSLPSIVVSVVVHQPRIALAARYFHWVVIAVVVLTVFIVVMMKVYKKNTPNISSYESVKEKFVV